MFDEPSPEMLHKLLVCDHIAGLLWWRDRTPDMFNATASRTSEHLCNQWNSRWAGKRACATEHGAGYLCGRIFGKDLLTHRIIIAMVTGFWPVNGTDHEDHNRSNNRWSNLREATQQENLKNMSMSRANTSGVTGVYWDKAKKKWQAKIHVNGKGKNLGYFDGKSEAIAARAAANEKYNFHPNHGAKP